MRTNNEDMILIGSELLRNDVYKTSFTTKADNRLLLAIADGMGGHLAGDIASRMTADLLAEALKGLEPRTDTLQESIGRINEQVFERQKNDVSLRGMGTTLTVLWEADEVIYCAHVGDSRAYLLRGGELRQVTLDHSMVAELMREGLITAEEAAVHPYRHIITRAVGTDPTVEADIITETKTPGDRWLICSDGLTGAVSDIVLKEHMEKYELQEAADRLLALALEQGGQDNITLVLTEVQP